MTKLTLSVQKYQNGRPAILAYHEGERFGTLTVNIPEIKMDADLVVIKTYSENEPWAMQVIKALPQMFSPTAASITQGYVTMPVYQLISDPDDIEVEIDY